MAVRCPVDNVGREAGGFPSYDLSHLLGSETFISGFYLRR